MKKITWACALLALAGIIGLGLARWESQSYAAVEDYADAQTEDAGAELVTTPESEEATSAKAPAAHPVPAKASVKSAKPLPAGVRLTHVTVDTHGRTPVVKIATTGKVRYTTLALAKPDRFLVKVMGAVLTWTPTTLDVNHPAVQKIRAAQHGTEVWVVVDLPRAQTWSVAPDAGGLRLAPGGAPQAVKAPVRNAAKPTPVADDNPALETEPVTLAQAPGVTEAASYKVVDVTLDDTGEKTRLVVTADGAIRYRLEREKKSDVLALWIHGAALTWNGKLIGLPKGAVRKVGTSVESVTGEPVVKLTVQLVQSTPYVVLKDQNQVILEMDNPSMMSESAPSRGNLNSRVSVDFQNADFVSVLRALAQDAGFDLVLTPGAQDLQGAQNQVTVSINDQPLETVLDLLLKSRKLAYAVGGNTLRIGLASEFSTETRVFTLKNVDVKSTNLKEALEGSLTEGGRSKIIVDGSANRVIVTAIPSDLFKCEAVLNRLDTPSRTLTRTFALNYAEVNKIAPLVKPMLSSGATLDINDRENAIMVTDIPGNMLRISSLIRSLDKKSKQVMIEARIVEVSLSNERDLGIRWSAAGNNPASNPYTSAASNPAAITAVGTLSVGTLQSGIDINATLSVMESKGTANTISNPRIATLDNQTATLSASQNIPYNTSVVSNGVVKTGVEYLELPISLSVTPHISKNNQVLLSPTVLKVTTVVNPGNPPETTTRSATTQMMVADGETVAIGGMVRDIESTKESKVPLLGDIPVLGYLFKSTVVIKDKVELVVFLTPHVLD